MFPSIYLLICGLSEKMKTVFTKLPQWKQVIDFRVASVG